MASITGGCLCGAVRYSSDAEPTFVGVCHCRDCQKYTGSAFATVVALPKSALTVSGEMQRFSKAGDSGKAIARSFCPTCGSSVIDEGEIMPGVVMIGTGTLDDPSWVKPTAQIYCVSAQPWVQLGGNIQGFERTAHSG